MTTSRLLSAALLAVVSTLAGPAAARDANGKGTLHLHELVMGTYEDFKRHFNPKYFAVSTNGLAHGYSACPDQACVATDWRALALQACQSVHGKLEAEIGFRLDGECFIFASAGSIVWEGEVIVLKENDYLSWLLKSGMVHPK